MITQLATDISNVDMFGIKLDAINSILWPRSDLVESQLWIDRKWKEEGAHHHWRRGCSCRSCCLSGCSLSGRRAFSSLEALLLLRAHLKHVEAILYLFHCNQSELPINNRVTDSLCRVGWDIAIMRRWVTDQQNWLTGWTCYCALCTTSSWGIGQKFLSGEFPVKIGLHLSRLLVQAVLSKITQKTLQGWLRCRQTWPWHFAKYRKASSAQ